MVLDVMGQHCRFESMQLTNPEPPFDIGRRRTRQPSQARIVVAQRSAEPRGDDPTGRGLPHPHEATQSEVTDDSFCIQGNWGGFAVLHGHWVGLKLLRAS